MVVTTLFSFGAGAAGARRVGQPATCSPFFVDQMEQRRCQAPSPPGHWNWRCLRRETERLVQQSLGMLQSAMIVEAMYCCLFASVRRSDQFTLRLPPRRRARYTVSGALPTGAVLLLERCSEMWALS